jgi:hypothetical protein
VPAFRGFDRTTYPITFLSIMGLSGLFEDVRVKVATAVAWFYGGADGGFEYWPQGSGGSSIVHEGAIENTAIVADNDFMWHRVRPTGRVEDGMVALTRDAELVRHDGGHWAIIDEADERAIFPTEQVRVSLSWKALAFADDADRRRHDEHTDDIGLSEVLQRFSDDFTSRGQPLDLPADPVADPSFIRTLNAAYVHYPS